MIPLEMAKFYCQTRDQIVDTSDRIQRLQNESIPQTVHRDKRIRAIGAFQFHIFLNAHPIHSLFYNFWNRFFCYGHMSKFAQFLDPKIRKFLYTKSGIWAISKSNINEIEKYREHLADQKKILKSIICSLSEEQLVELNILYSCHSYDFLEHRN